MSKTSNDAIEVKIFNRCSNYSYEIFSLVNFIVFDICQTFRYTLLVRPTICNSITELSSIANIVIAMISATIKRDIIKKIHADYHARRQECSLVSSSSMMGIYGICYTGLPFIIIKLLYARIKSNGIIAYNQIYVCNLFKKNSEDYD